MSIIQEAETKQVEALVAYKLNRIQKLLNEKALVEVGKKSQLTNIDEQIKRIEALEAIPEDSPSCSSSSGQYYIGR